jgi:hypothetical protein
MVGAIGYLTQNQATKSTLIQLLALTWVAILLVSCGSYPPPTTQPTFEVPESAPEPAKPVPMGTQEAAAAESSTVEVGTASLEKEVYWPTEAWRVAARRRTVCGPWHERPIHLYWPRDCFVWNWTIGIRQGRSFPLTFYPVHQTDCCYRSARRNILSGGRESRPVVE